MNVILLTAGHLTPYRQLMLEGYALEPDSFTSTPEERAAEPDSWWIARIADPRGMSAAFGAFDGDELIGTVALEFSSKPKTRHKAHVIGMYVSPRARGTGAGRALLDAVIDYAERREGTSVLNLTVTEGNDAAIGLYRSAGFEAFGTEPMAILTPSGFKAKVHMWRRIVGGAGVGDA